MGEDDFGRQARLRHEAEEKQQLVEKRKAEILETHGETFEKRVAIYGADDEINKAAVGLIAERFAKNTANIENLDVSQLNVQIEERRVGEAVGEAYRQAAERGREGPSAEQAAPSQEFGTPQWEAQAETAERQHGQGQRYDDLKNLAASGVESPQEHEAARQQHNEPSVAPEASEQAHKPVEVQQAGEAEGQDKQQDRVAEFLKAEGQDREERKAAMQELMREAGHEITQHEGQQMNRGGGLSI